MNPQIDIYLQNGCGRCALGGTPACKVHNWTEELKQLRMIVLACGLTEELKWGVPCYTFQKHNIGIVAAFKDYCALSFFKGALINDSEGILEAPGDNTQSVRLVKFTSVQQIIELEPSLKEYIHQAIEIEKAGLLVDFKKKDELVFPDELLEVMHSNPEFKSAFDALTPGRQRGYILHFSGSKQSKTRSARIEKSIPKILEGKGLNDR